MLDVIYDLDPGESIADIDGCFLLVLADRSCSVCDAFTRAVTRRMQKLPGDQQFQIAFAPDHRFGDLHDKYVPEEYPAIVRFFEGKVREGPICGVDACDEFLDEFLEDR